MGTKLPLLLFLLGPGLAWAQVPCPPVTVRVDNDVAGSGYSEERPENWESRDVAACARTYRYLSHTVGDGSRRGRAIWRPAVPGDGWYAVEISYRATVNRTDSARYLLYDDLGGRREHIEDQSHDDDCTRVDVGEIFCRVGGECRVVLDGDDGASAAADETVFRRTRCGDDPGPPPQGACDGIRAVADFEVCSETPETCAGVFSNGAGCAAYCAAAGMLCQARFGGEPGCMQEPQSPIDCAADNGHASDWCECVRPPAPPPEPDAAVPPPPPPPPPPPADAAVPGSNPPGPEPDAEPPEPGSADARAPVPPDEPADDTGLRPPGSADAGFRPPSGAFDSGVADGTSNRGVLLGASEEGNSEASQYDAPGCAQAPRVRSAPTVGTALLGGFALFALGGLAALRSRSGAKSRNRASRR